MIEITRNLAEPELKDLMILLKKELKLEINCHQVAMVNEVDFSRRTITASINCKKTFIKTGETINDVTLEDRDYALLIDCPFIVLGGGTAELTFPIKKGDECLICFNDRDLDAWFSSGQSLRPTTPAMHSFSDAIALIGLSSIPRIVQKESYDQSRAVLRYGTTMIGVGESQIKLANSIETLNDILQDLINEIKSLTTNPVSDGAPATISPASQALLDLVANRLGQLLE